jgi:hypothetical protein
MAALPAPKPSPLAKEAQKIKGKIDTLMAKMHHETNFSPTRSQLEEYAGSIIDYIHNHHAKVAPHEFHLKAAVIDLTEIPEMAPQMQRIAFLTALKDASHELELFLSCL